MNDSSDNRLDDLLRSWSDSETDQLSNEDKLIERIAARLATTLSPEPTPYRQATVFVVLACLAVCLACCAVLLPRDSDMATDGRNDLAGLRALAIPDQADVQRQTLVLDEFHRLFGSRFRWAAEERGDVRLEVENLQMDGVDDDGPLSQAVLVRVVLQRSNDSTSLPDIIEVLTHSEQTIQLSCGPNKTVSLEIWTYVLPDGMVMVTTSVAGDAAARTIDSLQPAGVATVVESDANQADPEWRIVQSVTLIGERLL